MPASDRSARVRLRGSGKCPRRTGGPTPALSGGPGQKGTRGHFHRKSRKCPRAPIGTKSARAGRPVRRGHFGAVGGGGGGGALRMPCPCMAEPVMGQTRALLVFAKSARGGRGVGWGRSSMARPTRALLVPGFRGVRRGHFSGVRKSAVSGKVPAGVPNVHFCAFGGHTWALSGSQQQKARRGYLFCGSAPDGRPRALFLGGCLRPGRLVGGWGATGSQEVCKG